MKLLKAKVMHKRADGIENLFQYSVYYLAVALEDIENGNLDGVLGYPHSFRSTDHGYRDGRSLRQWLDDVLAYYNYNIEHLPHITLVAMPRMFGYVFNPVSFWFCRDKDYKIKAVISEVNNTFGETHSYLCVREDEKEIEKTDWLVARKCFHVSPFIERTGYYRFRWDIRRELCGIDIHLMTEDDKTKLITSVKGRYETLSKKVSEKHSGQILSLHGR